MLIPWGVEGWSKSFGQIPSHTSYETLTKQTNINRFLEALFHKTDNINNVGSCADDINELADVGKIDSQQQVPKFVAN